jgi:uncharacterized protein YkwD
MFAEMLLCAATLAVGEKPPATVPAAAVKKHDTPAVLKTPAEAPKPLAAKRAAGYSDVIQWRTASAHATEAAKSKEESVAADDKQEESEEVQLASYVEADPSKAGDGDAQKPTAKIELAAIERNVVDRTNEERARHGLPPLEIDPSLMETAREHARWMTLTQRMQHTRAAVAENIAMGQPDSHSVLQSWMASRGHRANILNAFHLKIGVGAFRTEGGTIFWCQQFGN